METTKHIMLVLISILLTTNTAISEESKISETLTASCLLKITSDPAILPLDDTTIDYLLHSSGVVGKAAREILNAQLSGEAMEVALKIEWLADETDMMSPGAYGEESFPEENIIAETPDYGRQMMEMQMTGRRYPLQTERPKPARSTGRRMISEPLNITNEQMILLRIVVNLEEDNIGFTVEPAAQEFMKAIFTNLDVTLRDAYEEHIRRLRNRFELAQEEAARTESELREMQERLQTIAGSRILDRDRILGEIMDKRRNLQNLKMDKESDQVIVDAITQRIAESQKKLKEQIATDEVTKELQHIVELQMKDVQRENELVKNGNDAHKKELEEAERKLARARIELAQRRDELSKSAGGNLIESLNRELADRLVKAAQYQVNIESLNRQLSEAEELLNNTDDYELLTLKTEIARQNLREAIIWRDKISRKIRLLQPPAVSALGGD